jgi:hypothetical protein
MARLVAFTVTTFGLALIGVAGLAAYTAARPADSGVVVMSVPATGSRKVRPLSVALHPGPRTTGCTASSKLAG